MDVIGIDVILGAQYRRGALELRQRQALGRINPGYAQNDHLHPALLAPGEERTLRVDPAQGPHRLRRDRPVLVHPGPAAISVDTAGADVDQTLGRPFRESCDQVGGALVPVAALARRRQVQYQARASGERVQRSRIIEIAHERYRAQRGDAIGLRGRANQAENLVIAREERQRAQRNIAATNDQQPVHSKIVPALITIGLEPAAK